MHQKKSVSVLIAPLDWGLGHATRCIPIIYELLKQGAEVRLAASGPLRALLKQEFPGLEYLEIPGYRIRYKSGFLLKWGIIFKIPSLLLRIKREQDWLIETLKEHPADAVISDNRYGLHHKNIFSVIITHQLSIQSGLNKVRGWPLAVGRFADEKILKWNYKFISGFSECWVPDEYGLFSVAGKLSHPPLPPPVPTKYIGILSRFKRGEIKSIENSLLVLISGPEPSRTWFENILFEQLENAGMQAVVVRGLPGEGGRVPVRKGIDIYNHLPAETLNALINTSEIIIARSGYSTVMDLIRLKKNAILIPTPGQPEQEYLGTYLQERKWMYSVPEKNFELNKALSAFAQMEKTLPEPEEDKLALVIQQFLNACTQKRFKTPGAHG